MVQVTEQRAVTRNEFDEERQAYFDQAEVDGITIELHTYFMEPASEPL